MNDGVIQPQNGSYNDNSPHNFEASQGLESLLSGNLSATDFTSLVNQNADRPQQQMEAVCTPSYEPYIDTVDDN